MAVVTRWPVRAFGVGLLTTLAGATGWLLAGPPSDELAAVPPPCPEALDAQASPGWAGRSPGAEDRLVPMPLPEPRGPVSARACAYSRGSGPGYGLRRSVAVDPARTAALAGLLNRTAGQQASSGSPLARCRPGEDVAVLVFRYWKGPEQLVEVRGGECAVVATAARVETGRRDVVERVREVLA